MVLQGMRMGMMLCVRLLGRMMSTAATVVWLVVVRLLVVVRCPPVARQVASRMVRVGAAVGIGVVLLMVGVTAIRLGEPAGTLGQVHVAVAMVVGGMGRIIAVIVVLAVQSIRSWFPAVAAAPVPRTVLRTVVVRRQLVVVVAAVGRRPLVIRGMHVIAVSATGSVLERSLVAAHRHRAGTVITAVAAERVTPGPNTAASRRGGAIAKRRRRRRRGAAVPPHGIRRGQLLSVVVLVLAGGVRVVPIAVIVAVVAGALHRAMLRLLAMGRSLTDWFLQGRSYVVRTDRPTSLRFVSRLLQRESDATRTGSPKKWMAPTLPPLHVAHT